MGILYLMLMSRHVTGAPCILYLHHIVCHHVSYTYVMSCGLMHLASYTHIELNFVPVSRSCASVQLRVCHITMYLILTSYLMPSCVSYTYIISCGLMHLASCAYIGLKTVSYILHLCHIMHLVLMLCLTSSCIFILNLDSKLECACARAYFSERHKTCRVPPQEQTGST